MLLRLRTPLIGLIIVVLSHAPIPWIHNHDGMTKEQLVVHLQYYHHNGPSGSVPHDWHCHLIQLAAFDDSAEPEALVDSQSAKKWIGYVANSCHFNGVDCLPDLASAITSTAALDEANATLSRIDLYKLYGSLLI